MGRFRKLIVVKLDQGCDSFIYCGELHQRHLPVFGEKLKCLDGKVDGLERLPEVLLLHLTGDVAQVKRGGGWVDVLVILAAWFLKPV